MSVLVPLSPAILSRPATHSETYGPFTRNYPQPSWNALPSSERAKLTARQGHAFATSFPLRVIRPTKNPGEELVDVPRDGKTVGEIVLRGNIVMQGYFQDPEATARAFDGGYFRSGDLAVWHPDGSVQILDRIKDIIISGGEVRIPSPSQLYLGLSQCTMCGGFPPVHVEFVLARDRTR
jgi:acyl-CoA synthetase (AMP-forming)/AMP-acid ligase II